MIDSDFKTADYFHKNINKVYSGTVGAVVNKESNKMAKVIYEPAHINNDFKSDDIRHGNGKDYAKWIFSEEPDTAEGIFNNGLELMIDAFFEPNSSVGLHKHILTDEIYYIISGSITMTTITSSGEEVSKELKEGDAHVVYAGDSHYGVAGPEGCRSIVVAIKSK